MSLWFVRLSALKPSSWGIELWQRPILEQTDKFEAVEILHEALAYDRALRSHQLPISQQDFTESPPEEQGDESAVENLRQRRDQQGKFVPLDLS
ncbi:unnamed protein product [Linum trigynum]|uniref:Uncharacterized protein n=1 Tax=Linum trigynum TaxID=586398 RepID=A0AAV2D996_9ROSI